MDPACGDSAPSAELTLCFPEARASFLENLNRQREEGRLCDLSIQVQGRVFWAHRCVLAASSPYFHDQVLLKNVTTVSLPSVMDPVAFESVLSSAYTGRLTVVRRDVVNYVTVASFLQMWHIVDKCTEILKRPRPRREEAPPRQQSPSSTDADRGGDTLPPLATWRRPRQTDGSAPYVTEDSWAIQGKPRPHGEAELRDAPPTLEDPAEGGAPWEESEAAWVSSPPPPAPPPTFSPSPSPSSSVAAKLHFCHCGKAYALRSLRDRHIRMQHLNLRPFGCPLCAMSFKMNHHLTKHLKTHGGPRPYKCGVCGKMVVQRDGLLRHQARCQRVAAGAGGCRGYGLNQVKAEEAGGGDGGGALTPDRLQTVGHVFKEEGLL